MQNMVSKKVDAIIVTIFPTEGLGAGLAATQAAGIPVLSEGGGLSPGVAVDFDISLGQPVFDSMIASLGGKGYVLNLTYHGGRPCYLRAEMFKENQTEYPDLNVTTQEFPVPGFAEASVAATNAWVAANPADPNVKSAIFSCFDGSALAAISALKQNQRPGVEVYSFNGTAPALDAIRVGDMTASMWVDFAGLGKTMVDLVPEILAQGSAWEPKTLPADSVPRARTTSNSSSRITPRQQRGVAPRIDGHDCHRPKRVVCAPDPRFGRHRGQFAGSQEPCESPDDASA